MSTPAQQALEQAALDEHLDWVHLLEFERWGPTPTDPAGAIKRLERERFKTPAQLNNYHPKKNTTRKARP